MNIEKVVRFAFSQYRALQGELALMRAISLRGEDILPSLQQKVEVIDAWLRMLTDDEWFVVTKHLIDGLSWPTILIECGKRWGEALVPDERTLKRYQKAALLKIRTCIENHGLTPTISILFPE